MQEPIEPGELVRVDSDRPDAVRRTRGAYDPATIGVVSAEPGIVMGGGAFSVQALRERWGAEVVSEFEKLRPRLLRRVLVESPELRARSERLQSAEAFRQYLVTLAGQDAPAVPQLLTPGEKGRVPNESRLQTDSVPKSSSEHVAQVYLREKKDFDAFLETTALQRFFQERFAAVALAGRVPVRVDASYGAVEIGDPLTASPTPGVAMVASAPGFIIGTALEQLAEGTGEVLALVSRSWHGGRVHETDLEPSPLHSSSGRTADRALVPQWAEVSGRQLPHLGPEGNLFARGSIGTPSGPLAEYHLVSEPVEAGEVVVVDRQLADAVKIAETAADPAVIGIVSGSPGVVLGGRVAALAEVLPELAAAYEEARQRHDLDEQLRLWNDLSRAFHSVHAPVALSGTVSAKADAGYGSIGVGALLTSSPTPGHLMRATDPTPGTIVAKALEPLEAGTGRIRVLVMLR
jgi:hypothetical protein